MLLTFLVLFNSCESQGWWANRDNVKVETRWLEDGAIQWVCKDWDSPCSASWLDDVEGIGGFKFLRSGEWWGEETRWKKCGESVNGCCFMMWGNCDKCCRESTAIYLRPKRAGETQVGDGSDANVKICTKEEVESASQMMTSAGTIECEKAFREVSNHFQDDLVCPCLKSFDSSALKEYDCHFQDDHRSIDPSTIAEYYQKCSSSTGSSANSNIALKETNQALREALESLMQN